MKKEYLHDNRPEIVRNAPPGIADMLIYPEVTGWFREKLQQSYSHQELEAINPSTFTVEPNVVFFLSPETTTTEQPYITSLPIGDEIYQIWDMVDASRDLRECLDPNYPWLTVVNRAFNAEPVNPDSRVNAPSYHDLECMKSIRQIAEDVVGYFGDPIYMMSMIGREGHVRLLVMQENDLARAQSSEKCAESLKLAETEEDIELILKEYGYNCAFIEYKPGAKEPISETDIELLNEFEFSLKPISEEQSMISPEEAYAWKQLEEFVATATMVKSLEEIAEDALVIGGHFGVILDKRSSKETGDFYVEDKESHFSIERDDYGHILLTTYAKFGDSFIPQYEVTFPTVLYQTSVESEVDLADPSFSQVIQMTIEDSPRLYDYSPFEHPNDEIQRFLYLKVMKKVVKYAVDFRASEKQER